MTNREKNIRDFRTSFKITREEDSPDERELKDILHCMNLKPNCGKIVLKSSTEELLKRQSNRMTSVLWNHNTQYVLGRSKNGSLELKADEKGYLEPSNCQKHNMQMICMNL